MAAKLSDRENEVMALVTQRYTIKQAAILMHVEPRAAINAYYRALYKIRKQKQQATRAGRGAEQARKIAAEWGIGHES